MREEAGRVRPNHSYESRLYRCLIDSSMVYAWFKRNLPCPVPQTSRILATGDVSKRTHFDSVDSEIRASLKKNSSNLPERQRKSKGASGRGQKRDIFVPEEDRTPGLQISYETDVIPTTPQRPNLTKDSLKVP